MESDENGGLLMIQTIIGALLKQNLHLYVLSCRLILNLHSPGAGNESNHTPQLHVLKHYIKGYHYH